MYCYYCGCFAYSLDIGGCGGRGSLYGCPKCDSVFEQTNNGLMPEHPQYKCNGRSYKEERVHFSEQIKVLQDTWPNSPSNGKWYWSEIGYGESHFFDSKEDAERELANYRARMLDDLPNPVCPSCNIKAPSFGGSKTGIYQCRQCRIFHSNGSWCQV